MPSENSLAYINPVSLNPYQLAHGALFMMRMLPPALAAASGSSAQQQPQPVRTTIAVAVSNPCVPAGCITAHPSLWANALVMTPDPVTARATPSAAITPIAVEVSPLAAVPKATHLTLLIDRVKPETPAQRDVLINRMHTISSALA